MFLGLRVLVQARFRPRLRWGSCRSLSQHNLVIGQSYDHGLDPQVLVDQQPERSLKQARKNQNGGCRWDCNAAVLGSQLHPDLLISPQKEFTLNSYLSSDFRYIPEKGRSYIKSS